LLFNAACGSTTVLGAHRNGVDPGSHFIHLDSGPVRN
jgi:hypothetical protein